MRRISRTLTRIARSPGVRPFYDPCLIAVGMASGMLANLCATAAKYEYQHNFSSDAPTYILSAAAYLICMYGIIQPHRAFTKHATSPQIDRLIDYSLIPQFTATFMGGFIPITRAMKHITPHLPGCQ